VILMLLAGQEKQWRFLQRSVELDKLAHAYLFSGSPGLGKKTLAREFSRLINCQATENGQPCGQCPSCQEFAKNCHPDFLWLEPTERGAGENETNLIRGLTQWLSLRPVLGKHKIAVINLFENFSAAAQSALLKTLEEPAGQAVLVLLSSQADLILPTILSRVQVIRFVPWSKAQIRDLLMTRGVPEEMIEEAVALASGNPAQALSLVDLANLKAEQKSLQDFVELGNSDLATVFRQVKTLSSERDQAILLLEDWLSFMRQVFLDRIGLDQAGDGSKHLTATKSWPVSKICRFLQAGQQTDSLLRLTNVNCQLALENLLLKLN